MCSTCFELEGSSSGRQLVVMVCCFYMLKITIKGFCTNSECKTFELFRYIDINMKHATYIYYKTFYYYFSM